MVGGLNRLPKSVKIYLTMHAILVLMALALALWVGWLAYTAGVGENLKRTPTDLPENLRSIAEHVRTLRLAGGAHSHLLGHILMLFVAAVPYLFTRDREKVKIIVTTAGVLGTIIYSIGRYLMSSYLMMASMGFYSPAVAYMCLRLLVDLWGKEV